jgi:hypothetical protein
MKSETIFHCISLNIKIDLPVNKGYIRPTRSYAEAITKTNSNSDFCGRFKGHTGYEHKSSVSAALRYV